LAPHVPFSPGIDLCKSLISKGLENEATSFIAISSIQHPKTIGKLNVIEEDGDGKLEMVDGNSKADVIEHGSFIFSPPEFKNITLHNFLTFFEGNLLDTHIFGHINVKVDGK